MGNTAGATPGRGGANSWPKVPGGSAFTKKRQCYQPGAGRKEMPPYLPILWLVYRKKLHILTGCRGLLHMHCVLPSCPPRSKSGDIFTWGLLSPVFAVSSRSAQQTPLLHVQPKKSVIFCVFILVCVLGDQIAQVACPLASDLSVSAPDSSRHDEAVFRN